jgi:hypothetical protein
MTRTLALVCEATGDFEMVCALVDRLLCEWKDYIDATVLDAYRCWQGYYPGTSFLPWTQVKDLARNVGIRVHRGFVTEPPLSDCYAGIRAIRLFADREPPPDALLLVRDSDGDEERIGGLPQARDSVSVKPLTIIGVAHTKRECWLLAGFEPRDEEERSCLAALRQELGFDPRLEAERLTAEKDHFKRSAKRVLHHLTNGDHERELACLSDLSLEVLKERGCNSGLAAFLDELERLLLPLF